jgi:hypothetical protein
MFCDVGEREMGISMVIAAWGEGFKVCLCTPSSSSDCSAFIQNAHKKRWLGLGLLRKICFVLLERT